jgi:hypothetical protein
LKTKVVLNFSPEAANTPITHNLIAKYHLLVNILRAEIDLDFCLDTTLRDWHTVLRNAHRALQAEWQIEPSKAKTQMPFALRNGQVLAGYSGDWTGGKNSLDHAVIERAIEIAKQQRGLTCDTVRGLFLEEGPIYENSWLFEGAHIAISVRDPVRRLVTCSAIPV